MLEHKNPRRNALSIIVRHRSQSIMSLMLLVVVVLIYMGNGRVIGSGDTLPTRYLPIAILRHGTFILDGFPVLYNDRAMKIFSFGESKPYYLKIRSGHYLSQYPPGPALLALPVYALPVLAGMSSDSQRVPQLEKVSATLITAFSVLFLFWSLRVVVAEKLALVIALIYAFGTSSFSVSSQALWQHGPGQFFLALALYLLVKGIRDQRYLPYSGFALSAAVAMRPTDALLALPIGLYIVHRHRSVLLRFLLLAFAPAALTLIYNRVYLGSVIGFSAARDPVAWSMPVLRGLPGLLFSPARGLFIYSPIVILSVWGMFLAWRAGDWFLRYLSLGPVLVVLLYSKWFMWWGGYCYGPRMLADLFPFLCFFLYPVAQKIKGRYLETGAFVALALLSIWFHALGAYWDDGRWNAYPDVNEHQYRLWSWRDSPIVYCSRNAYYKAGDVYHTCFDRLRSTTHKNKTDHRCLEFWSYKTDYLFNSQMYFSGRPSEAGHRRLTHLISGQNAHPAYIAPPRKGTVDVESYWFTLAKWKGRGLPHSTPC